MRRPSLAAIEAVRICFRGGQLWYHSRWMRFPNTTSALLLLCPFLAALLGGCSAERYKKSADREVYAIVASKRKAVTGAEEPFDPPSPPPATF